jgi:UDP-glucose 4-epimerase
LRSQRSFIGIDNLCDALRIAASHEACRSRTFVVADRETWCVADLARLMASALGANPKRVVAIPAVLLRALASAAGRGALFDKLAAELVVDASAFGRATGWRPPRAAAEGLREAALSFGPGRAMSMSPP